MSDTKIKKQIIEGDEVLFEMLDDGYHVVELLTDAALHRESLKMQHNLGNGGYDRYYSNDIYVYLSLRDSNGKSHATIQIKDEFRKFTKEREDSCNKLGI